VESRLLQEIPSKAGDFNPQQIANTFHALSKFDHPDTAAVTQVLTRLCQEIPRQAGDFNPQDIANTFNALSNLRHWDPSVVTRLCQEIPSKAGDFNRQNIANTLLALAMMGQSHPQVVTRLCQEIPSKASEFNVQNICNTLYALVALDHFDKPAIGLLYQLCAPLDPQSMPEEGKTNLFLVACALRLSRPDWTLALPSALSDEIDLTWAATKRHAQSSKLHRMVSDRLEDMDVTHHNEYDQKELSIDIALPEQRVAIEVDGPSYFASNQPRQMWGHTRFNTGCWSSWVGGW
jgi:hypothetical protein